MEKVREGETSHRDGEKVTPHLIVRFLISRVNGMRVLILVAACYDS